MYKYIKMCIYTLIYILFIFLKLIKLEKKKKGGGKSKIKKKYVL